MRHAAVALALVLSSCAKPEPPRITPHSVQVTSVTPLEIALRAELDVENPNAFPLMVRSVSGTLRVGAGTEVGTAKVDTNATIPARATERVASDVRVRWSNLGALAPLALSPGPVPYVFGGVANVGGEKLNLDVPFELKGNLSREQILQAGLRGLGLPGAGQ